MEKQIKIGDRVYDMKASAFTQFAYKNETGRSFLEDISKLIEVKDIDTDNIVESLTSLEPVINILLDVSYIMINEAKPNTFNNREEFYKSISTIFDDEEGMNTLTDVITLAISPLYRGKL